MKEHLEDALLHAVQSRVRLELVRGESGENSRLVIGAAALARSASDDSHQGAQREIRPLLIIAPHEQED
jgi:hypothetical protein